MSGTLRKADYAGLTAEAERLIREHGRIHILVDMHDFHGWTASGLWEDVTFSAGHADKIARVAFVGEAKWQEAIAELAKPFTSAAVRYFERAAADEARRWVASAP